MNVKNNLSMSAALINRRKLVYKINKYREKSNKIFVHFK